MIDNRLIDAVRNQDIQSIDTLLTEGLDLNARNSNGSTLLMYAVDTQSRPVVDHLIDLGADLSPINNAGHSALDIAVHRENLDITSRLIERGAPVEDTHFTALLRAVNQGNEALLKALLRAKPDLHRPHHDLGPDALYKACVIANQPALFALLLEYDAPADHLFFTELTAAIESSNQYQMFCTLMEKAASTFSMEIPDYASADPVWIDQAIQLTEKEDNYFSWCKGGVTKVFQAGVNDAIDHQGTTPLMRACANGDLAGATFLLERGADPAITRKPPKSDHRIQQNALDLAMKTGNTALVELLMKHSPVVARDPDRLHDLCSVPDDSQQRLDTMNLWIDQGADPFFKSREGNTNLHFAARAGNTKLMQRLVEIGLDASDLNAHKDSVLHAAAAAGTAQGCTTLISKGADVNVINNKGITPVMLAAQSGQPKVVEILLKAGSHADAVDQRDRSALEIAVEQGFDEIAALLIDAGADPEKKRSEQGQEPNPLIGLFPLQQEPSMTTEDRDFDGRLHKPNQKILDRIRDLNLEHALTAYENQMLKKSVSRDVKQQDDSLSL